MTETDWETATEPRAALSILRHRRPLTDRQLRLFAVAVASEVEPLMEDDRSRRALRVAEAVADGLADDAERERAQGQADAARSEAEARFDAEVAKTGYAAAIAWSPAAWKLLIPLEAAAAAHATLHPPATMDETFLGDAPNVVSTALSAEEWVRQVERSESGERRNPGDEEDDDEGGEDARSESRLTAYLRDIVGDPFHPVSFSPEWRSEAVMALARGIYEERAFERMPVLADALEDAGCTDDNILAHCREVCPHVRGCFVVDAVLGK